MTTATFKNQHGEKFILHKTELGTVRMSGDEIDSMVRDSDKINGHISLFNEHFNVWSDEELVKLGSALQRLGKK